MTTEDFIIELFCWVYDHMPGIPKHPQAKLYPSELVTIGLLFALKGGYFRAFYPLVEPGLRAPVRRLARTHPVAALAADTSVVV